MIKTLQTAADETGTAEIPADSDSEPRSYSGFVFLIFGAYLAFATILFYVRGFKNLSPDRWAPFLFLAALALGRGRTFVRDWTPFVLLFFGYEYMRGVAGEFADMGLSTTADHGNIKIDYLLDSERWFFRGTIPSLWLQKHLYTPGTTHWYDVMSGAVYLLHFVFPLVFAFVLWLRNKDHYWRFVITLIIMSYIAFVFFFLLPSAPPWLANDWGIIEGLERPSHQAYRALMPNRADNFNTFQIWTKASANPVAPFPSLHTAFPWLVLLYAVKFFGRKGLLFLPYNAAVWFAITYLGLHWVVDIFAGIALATGAFILINCLWPRLSTANSVSLLAPLIEIANNSRRKVNRSVLSWQSDLTSRTWFCDAKGVAATVVVTGVIFFGLLEGASVLGIDSAIQFYPLYGLLGNQIRNGDLPFWNNHIYGGMPLIADPQSGWMYLPAMLAFLITPIYIAIKLFMVFHLLLTGLATYVLGRLLGFGWLAAAATVVAYQLSGWMVFRSGCCTVELDVAAWLPVALVGVELIARARSLLPGLAACGLAGFASAQILAAWTGQGSYYTGLMIGGYLVYRVLIDPPAPKPSILNRALSLTTYGLGTGCLAVCLSAAALLPRLKFVQVSNLANGYPWEGVHGGFSGVWGALSQLLGRSTSYLGATSFALALTGLALAKLRFATPFFAGVAVFAVILTLTEPTLVHRIFYLLPRFEELNRNQPQRVLIVVYLAIALIVGAAIESLPKQRLAVSRSWLLWVPTALAIALVIRAEQFSTAVPQSSVIAVIAVSVVALAGSLLPLPELRKAMPLLIIVILLADLLTSNSSAMKRYMKSDGVAKVELDSYYDVAPAAQFLSSIENAAPYRYFGYDAAIAGKNGVLYRYSFEERETADLAVNNRAALLGLEDIQGGNAPVHIALYDDLIAAANGRIISYHDTNITAVGINSPIIDLLNVRYLIVPAAVAPGRPDLLHLNQQMPTVYLDEQVRILENTNALPRAWIVHEARTVSAEESLRLIESGEVDPRQVALLETEAPAIGSSPAPDQDIATITRRSSGSIVVETQTSVDSLLVLSEIVYPDWHAYIDGVRMPVLTVDHALRGVAIPAGSHSVEFRYESVRLRAGLALSIVTYVLLAGVWIVAGMVSLRNRRNRAPRLTL